MYGYNQIFLVGGAPSIGESRVLCLERSGEWKGPPACRGEGESFNPEIAGYRCPLARLRIRRTQALKIVQIVKEKAHVILFFEHPFYQVRN